jgi:hypothetical protein
VCLRFRPLSAAERAQGETTTILSLDERSCVIQGGEDREPKSYTFDAVFPTYASQCDVYAAIGRPIIVNFVAGYNGCLFAYGQTGSGKTHTMMGPDSLMEGLTAAETGSLSAEEMQDLEESMGILPRAVRDIFDIISADAAPPGGAPREYSLEASCVEIYREKVKDLLDLRPEKADLAIGVGAGGQPELKGASRRGVSSPQELMAVMQESAQARRVGATLMNERSSRSHSIFMLRLVRDDPNNGTRAVSVLYLCDLAGSEMVGKTNVAGEALREAGFINQSLSTLGLVINKLTDRTSAHIPYRDSKLTHLLQNALGGNSKTALLISASPSPMNYAETVSTLRFGLSAKTIQQVAKVNVEMSPQELKLHAGRLEAALGAAAAVLGELRAATEGTAPVLVAGAAVGATAALDALLMRASAAARGAEKLLGKASGSGSPSGSVLTTSSSTASLASLAASPLPASAAKASAGAAAAAPLRVAAPAADGGGKGGGGGGGGGGDDDDDGGSIDGDLVDFLKGALEEAKGSITSFSAQIKAKDELIAQLKAGAAALEAPGEARRDAHGAGAAAAQNSELQGKESQLQHTLEDRDIYIKTLENKLAALGATQRANVNKRLKGGDKAEGENTPPRVSGAGSAAAAAAGGGDGSGGGASKSGSPHDLPPSPELTANKRSTLIGSIIGGFRGILSPRSAAASTGGSPESPGKKGGAAAPAPSAAAGAAVAGAAGQLSRYAPMSFFNLCEAGDVAAVAAALADDKALGESGEALLPPALHLSEDRSNRTCLLYAARGGCLEVLQLLRAAGADLATRDRDSRSALAYAARRGHSGVAAWLLDVGLSAKQSDMHGLTPLHQAVLAKSAPMVELLLARGADPCARDSNGLTAYKLAKRFLPPDQAESRSVLSELQRFLKTLPLEQQAAAGLTSAAGGNDLTSPPPPPPPAPAAGAPISVSIE